MDFHIAGLVLLSYLAGGIPSGYLLVKRLRGFDIRERGSGNPGAANVFRMAGSVPGALTLAIDALKGYLPILLAHRLYPGQETVAILCGAAAIIGHDWTIFLGFKGGKGVATSAGVFAAIVPKTIACTVVIFILGVGFSGHISIGSMAAASSLPVFCLLLNDPRAFTKLALAAAILILYKHIPNMKRLWGKKELQINEKK